MSMLMVKNETPMRVNLAICHQGKLEECYNYLEPGAVVNFEFGEDDWQDFVVMASEGNQTICKHDEWNDIVGRSIDSAEKYGIFVSHFQSRKMCTSRNALFAAISLAA